MGGKHSKCFSNWSENIQTDKKIKFPKTDIEIIQLIKKYSKTNSTIRVVGAGHSISPTVCTNNSSDRKVKLISLSKYSLVPENININHEDMTVTVNAGWSLSKLYHELNKYRYFLETQPASAAFSVSGLCCTPVHGAKLGASHLSDSILAMRLIDDKGDIIIKTRDDPDFTFYQLSLGIFGIVTGVTFKIYKYENFTMTSLTHPINFDDPSVNIKLNEFLLNCIRKSINSETAEYAQCFLDLHASKVLCLHWIESKQNAFIRDYIEPLSVGKMTLLETFLKRIDSDYRQSPFTLALISKFARYSITQSVENDYQTNRDLFWLTTAIRAYFMEYYIPIYTENTFDDNQESLVDYVVDYESDSKENPDISLDRLYDAINVVVKTMRRFKKANKTFIPDLPCEFRFVVSSQCKLSPIYYNSEVEKKTIYLAIEIPCLANNLDFKFAEGINKDNTQLISDFTEFYSQVEKGWIELGGRSHWGKLYSFHNNKLFDSSNFIDHKTKILLQNLVSTLFLNSFSRSFIGLND